MEVIIGFLVLSILIGSFFLGRFFGRQEKEVEIKTLFNLKMAQLNNWDTVQSPLD